MSGADRPDAGKPDAWMDGAHIDRTGPSSSVVRPDAGKSEPAPRCPRGCVERYGAAIAFEDGCQPTCVECGFEAVYPAPPEPAKVSLEELEAILNSDEPCPIEILPNGELIVADHPSKDERALACLVNDAPDSALSVFEDGTSIAIVLRHAPESVRMAVVRFAQGLLADPESLQIPTTDGAS